MRLTKSKSGYIFSRQLSIIKYIWIITKLLINLLKSSHLGSGIMLTRLMFYVSLTACVLASRHQALVVSKATVFLIQLQNQTLMFSFCVCINNTNNAIISICEQIRLNLFAICRNLPESKIFQGRNS